MTIKDFTKKSAELGYQVKDVYCNFGCYNYDYTAIIDKNGKQVARVLDGYFGSYFIDKPVSIKECNLIIKYAFTKTADRKQPGRPMDVMD